MNALAELRKRAWPAATVATSATFGRHEPVVSQESQESQGVNVKTGKLVTPFDALKTERARLLELAAAEWIDTAHVHRLHDADLAGCVGLDDGQRVTFLHMLTDTAERHAGHVPQADTAAMVCQHRGPVWIHPDIAAVLPFVGGWPRALGCPWCFVRKAGGVIPRPPITCAECQHFMPGAINPTAGMGSCCDGGMRYPMQRHHCASFHLEQEPTP